MEISRRRFMRYVSASAVALGFERADLLNLERGLAAATPGVPVIWLNGAGCTGCSISLLNAVNPSIDQFLTDTVDLRYHSALLAASGEPAVSQVHSTVQSGGYILIVEGAIPAAKEGRYCQLWKEKGKRISMAQAVTSLAARAKHLVAVGTCAAYGGISRANAATENQGLGAFLGKPVINLPGCPAHPDWIMGTLGKLIGGSSLDLDEKGRPRLYYGTPLCRQCPRHHKGEAFRLGESGRCLEELGCRGRGTGADCQNRKWNNGQNWCVGVNSPCIGCTEPTFPLQPLRGRDGRGGFGERRNRGV